MILFNKLLSETEVSMRLDINSDTKMIPQSIAASLLGVHIDTIRRYRVRGFIRAEQLVRSNYFYSVNDLQLLNCILKMRKQMSMTVEGIKRALQNRKCWVIRGCDPIKHHCDVYTHSS